MRLIYHPDAEAELIEAAQFYELRLTTLGSQFLDGADRAIRVIHDAPERWSVIEADVRHYFMPRFPYAIYNRVLWAIFASSPLSTTAVTRTTGATVSPNRRRTPSG